ncbi:hypothetical protein DMW06_20965 [Vibrio parahaemolyticus]|nr:transposase [Vibrio parahaemolyticus]EGR3002781.1 hypothetical protein [Vibrio parahaemolyticus]
MIASIISTLKSSNTDSLLWMNRDGIQKKLPMTLNVSVIKLSPYSPELNPIEQVWRWLRQRDLSNQSFMDYDDIISKSAMHGIGFGLLPKSHQNVIEKMDRPDQLVFQIGINGEVVALQIIENGLSWKGK